MDNFMDRKIRLVEDLPIPESGLAVKFLTEDKEEARAWAKEHAQAGWIILPGQPSSTLLFNHKEGDTAPFPFTYIWDGEKIVKQYIEQTVEAPEEGKELTDDPRLGKRVRLLDESQRRGTDVFGTLVAITQYTDSEVWDVNCNGFIASQSSRLCQLEEKIVKKDVTQESGEE